MAYRGVTSVGIVCPRPRRAVGALNLLMSSLEMGSSPASAVDLEEEWSLPSSERSIGIAIGVSRKGSVSCSPYAFSEKCSKELVREQRVLRNATASSLSYSGVVDSETTMDIMMFPPSRAISPPPRSLNPVVMDSRFGESDDFVASGLTLESGDIFEFSPSERFLLNH